MELKKEVAYTSDNVEEEEKPKSRAWLPYIHSFRLTAYETQCLFDVLEANGETKTQFLRRIVLDALEKEGGDLSACQICK